MSPRRIAELGLLSVLVGCLPLVASYGADTAPKPPKPPKVSVADASVVETDAGSVASFTVTLTKGLGKKVKVWWKTVDGTATAPDDYTAASGKVVFKGPAKTQAKTISVNVTGDDLVEPGETFKVRLTKITNGAIKRATATSTILNDDAVLTVSRSGSGSGTVTSTPAGVSCPPACTMSVSLGSTVTLTAGSTSASFAGWTGACAGVDVTCSVTMTGDRTVDASFKRLDNALPPTYGRRSLTSGFVPDPSTVSATGGGPVKTSYLGVGCLGYATEAPTFSVQYAAGPFALLRFYFVGSGDPTMVINDPAGKFFCVDDSFGTLNPTIDFNNPVSGRYDIWVGTRAAGASTSGTLYVTENSGNHP